ncbi:hypothetical protein BH09SUM1_BH09SUM1_07530 [soil metagenome]
MSIQEVRHSLATDLRRMAPVLGIVLVTAATITLSMKFIAHHHLQTALAANQNACNFAEVFKSSADRRIPKIRALAKETATGERKEIKDSALGILKGNEDVKLATADLMRARELCPSNRQIDYMLAVLNWYEGNAAAAYVYLGDNLKKENDALGATAEYRLALAQDPNYAPALLSMAGVLSLTNPAAALDMMNGKEDELAKTADGKLILGGIHAQVGDVDKALKYLQDGLREKPSDNFAIVAISQLYQQQKRQKEGAEFLESLGDGKKSTVFVAYQEAAALYREITMYPEEEHALRKALGLYSNSPEINFELAVSLWQQKKYAEARDFARQASEYNLKRVSEMIQATGIDPSQKPAA